MAVNQHQKQFLSLIKQNAHSHRIHEVFTDFCELSAIAISNAVDKTQFEVREARYMQIIGAYTKDEAKRFAEMLTCVVESLSLDMGDCLGELFMSLELGNHFRGQFFTPFHISYMMAKLLGGNEKAIIEEKGYFTLMEPAAGAGAMVIAMAKSLLDDKINYQKVMHATTIDVDTCAVHMCYIQLALLGIPAVVFHGNSLTNEYWNYWQTPMHILDLWEFRMRHSTFGQTETEPHPVPEIITPEPMPSPIHHLAAKATKAAKSKQENQLLLF